MPLLRRLLRLLRRLGDVFRGEMEKPFREQLIDLWNGKLHHDREVVNYALDGTERNLLLHFSVFPGHEHDWSRVQVALTDITARKKAEAYLEYLGKHDVLTKLHNRAFYTDELNRLERKSLRPVSAIVIDLNGLKEANDERGHDAGDQLLMAIAQRLTSAVRESDTVARLGGDEFVLLVQQLDEDLETAVAQAGRIGDKVVAQLSQPCAIGAVQYQGSASVGVSMFLGHALDLDEILKRADLAMYQAKAAGRNTVRFSIRRSRRASMPAPHWKRTCARPYNATSWCCTTSPRWTPRAAVWVWRPWCAGNTRSAGRCSRWTSFRWPRRRG